MQTYWKNKFVRCILLQFNLNHDIKNLNDDGSSINKCSSKFSSVSIFLYCFANIGMYYSPYFLYFLSLFMCNKKDYRYE